MTSLWEFPKIPQSFDDTRLAVHYSRLVDNVVTGINLEATRVEIEEALERLDNLESPFSYTHRYARDRQGLRCLLRLIEMKSRDTT